MRLGGHADLLALAFPGPLPEQFREMAQRYQMTVAGLLQNALVACEATVTADYQPGTALAEWKAHQTPEAAQA